MWVVAVLAGCFLRRAAPSAAFFGFRPDFCAQKTAALRVGRGQGESES